MEVISVVSGRFDLYRYTTHCLGPSRLILAPVVQASFSFRVLRLGIGRCRE